MPVCEQIAWGCYLKMVTPLLQKVGVEGAGLGAGPLPRSHNISYILPKSSIPKPDQHRKDTIQHKSR